MENEKVRKYNLIIFDLDGTLTDPKVGIIKSIQYALSKFNIEESNTDKLMQFIGPPLLESFEKYYFPEKPKARKAVDFYREYYSENGIFETNLYPGILDLLSQIYKKGRQMIVATSKPTVFAERILKHFDLFAYFSSIVGSNLDCTRASKDEVIKYAISDLSGIQKHDMIMIGDREQDIIAAKNLGIDSIAVTYGYGSIKELQKAEPTYFASYTVDLRRLLEV